MSQSDIVVRGAREHNLRDVSLTLPRNKLIVMTGVSGSGKSSLAFDTLYAEGQRRYVESLSSYARQFLGQMPKPEVDSISGLAPSISIQQKTSSRNPRSTVGTITEIYDYLRVLFARVGQGHCHRCSREITAQSVEQIIESISSLESGTKFLLLAPLIQGQKGEYRDLFEDLLKQGFLRARVDGNVVQLTDDLKLDRQMRHTIEVVIDRLVAGKVKRQRLAEAVEQALRLSGGTLLVLPGDAGSVPQTASAGSTKPSRKRSTKKAVSKTKTTETGNGIPAEGRLYSSLYACTHCGISYEPPTPQLFSFNSPQGMCLDCNGLGRRFDFVIDALIPDPAKSIAKGAIELFGPMRKVGKWRRHIFEGGARAIEQDLKLDEGSLFATPWEDVPDEAKQLFLYGTGKRNVTFSWRYSGGVWKHGGTYDGVIPELMESYRKARNPMRRKQLENRMEFVDCQSCCGARLNGQARNVTLTSSSDAFMRTGLPASLSLPGVCSLSIEDAFHFFEKLDLDETSQFIATEALKEIRGRLSFLLRCGLNYLALDRSAPTLSGGETQRIRLAGQIGCGLVGVVYILDEPSIGLHPRDNRMLIESLCDLRDQGNTVIVVEHDEETMEAADHIVDFGPGPGVRGGEIVASGSLAELKRSKRSVTGQYLSGKASIAVPETRRKINRKKQIKVTGARHNNLKNISVSFPLESFICVTGVSGGGKSSLVNDILWQVLNRDVNRGNGNPGKHKTVAGLDHIDKAIDIDQSPIGRTPRSNPATYVKLFDEIRNMYAKLPDSKLRGYKPGRFSFNVAGGRCEACEGHGSNRLEMDFLADVWVTCPVCEGRRFSHETLEVRFKDRNIAEVLEMDVQQALEHFENVPRIHKLLSTLHAVGLDYLKLGQPSPTLSGGEAQRIKLARELGKRSTGQTIYLLDEPTTGLHFADIQKLLEVLHGFVDAGNTVLVVEHNLDVVKTADWIIDLGPEGGAGGGTIVATGTPEQIAANPDSHTGQALRPVIGDRIKITSKSNQKKTTKAAPKLKSVARRKAKPKSTSETQSARTQSQSNASGLSIADELQAHQRWQTESTSYSSSKIHINGAGQHNLQDVSVTIPRDKFSVFCGPSGSGKSSLAMDTLYAEGQRRYVESLSAYARQFLGQMPKPRVDHIHGLSPAIAIEQKSTGHTPRSTVGTVTEIYDYLRILFTRLGELYCPDCNIPVETQTTDEVIDRLMSLESGTKLVVLAPQEVRVGQSYEKLWEKLQADGFVRVRVDGTTHRVDEVPAMDRKRKHVVEVVIDRVTVRKGQRGRIADSVEAAMNLGQGLIHVAYADKDRPEEEWKVEQFSLHHACEQCGRSFEELTPNNFSFNSPLGWCPSCEGLGVEQGTNLAELVGAPHETLKYGAVTAWPVVKSNPMFAQMLEAMAAEFRIPLDVPFDRLDPASRRIILYGTGDRWISMPVGPSGTPMQFQYKGLYPAIEEAARVSHSYRQKALDLVGEVPCSTCGGSRLRDDAGSMRFNGSTLQHVCELPLDAALALLKKVKLDRAEKKIAGDLLTEATSRLSFLVEVGLHYITLSRSLPTLSGGEMQRIRLAGQIGRALTGVLYVLDEPTIGLHPRDNRRLLGALHKLRDLGNTLVLVEHDREVLESADRLYDFGPGAGRFGGNVVAEGTPTQISKRKTSMTGQFLSDRREIAIPEDRREGLGEIELRGARLNNLKNVELKIPLGTLTCITGVSGSGKSSLIENTLAPAAARRLHKAGVQAGPFDELLGLEQINKVVAVDQKPLGSTPKSNPGTYTGVFDEIRELFARLPDARVRGYRPGRFSFNRQGGRCETCEGNGQKCIEMHFLPDVWVECDDCHGKRYNNETLSVKYRGRSIADVLEMPIAESFKLFDNIPKIRRYLATLCAIGLDYLTLGQSAPTLSGGEAQRVKLAAELARPNTGQTLYLLDEPTTGLHFDDIEKLLKVLNSLVEQGNTVVVIEHNLDVIKTADWIVDIGPEAGNEGGYVVASGTPEEVVTYSKKARKRGSKLHRSHTGEMLEPVLKGGTYSEREVFDAVEAGEKQEGDLDIGQIGRSSKMPWQLDGHKWHTEDRLAANGKPAKWEGSILEKVTSAIEASDAFADINWNDRSVVEVTGKKKADGWFLHALTGNEWLVQLKFRVRRNTFKQPELRQRFNLKTLDDIDDLPVYSRTDRVKCKNLKGPWQEVSIAVHWLREIETPEFDAFLNEAIASFSKKLEEQKQKPGDLMPWKVLGRKWHVSRKGFPSNKRVLWQANVLELLFDRLLQSMPDIQVDWTGKSTVQFSRPNGEPWATVHSKRRTSVGLSLFHEAGEIALGRVSTFGTEPEIASHKGGKEIVKLQFTDEGQVLDTEFVRFLKDHAAM